METLCGFYLILFAPKTALKIKSTNHTYKNKNKGIGNIGRDVILNQVDREGLGVKVTAEERPEGGKGTSTMI